MAVLRMLGASGTCLELTHVPLAYPIVSGNQSLHPVVGANRTHVFIGKNFPAHSSSADRVMDILGLISISQMCKFHARRIIARVQHMTVRFPEMMLHDDSVREPSMNSSIPIRVTVPSEDKTLVNFNDMRHHARICGHAVRRTRADWSVQVITDLVTTIMLFAESFAVSWLIADRTRVVTHSGRV